MLKNAERVDVAILGAGIVGLSTAYFLAKAGRSVMVIDRLPGPGLDTSFANGAQISVCQAEPWAGPAAPFKVLKWLLRDDAPLLFRPRFDPAQWRWLLFWLGECLPSNNKRNTIAITDLALHSRTVLGQMRRELGLEYDQRTNGIIQFFRDQESFDKHGAVCDLLRSRGCRMELLDRKALLAREPSLAYSDTPIAGGAHSPDDETGDAHLFTKALADVCRGLGVTFRYSHEVVGMPHDRGRGVVETVRVMDLATSLYHEIAAGQVVVALGSYAPAVLRPLGIATTLYPTKGYSLTIPLPPGIADDRVPMGSITDDGRKTVFTRMGDRLRVAGTAELDGFSRDLNPVRCRAMLDLTRQLFPALAGTEPSHYWTGLRPTTPSNMPYLGRTKYRNLFLNVGHGTLGWTMGPGSGERLARMMVESR